MGEVTGYKGPAPPSGPDMVCARGRLRPARSKCSAELCDLGRAREDYIRYFSASRSFEEEEGQDDLPLPTRPLSMALLVGEISMIRYQAPRRAAQDLHDVRVHV